ncbi:MAG: cytochrome c biogenesis protein DipZ [Proteobacteria bacterium]|nr:cytochrome c biogenesis protein DipZ [Pseudomonadota bacterium]
MLLFILAYAGGALTIVSPCILPVLPFVFARADRPFVNSGLPLLFGMAVTFAAVATLAAVGGGWAVAANEYGRYGALLLLAAFGVTLLFPAIAERLTQPLVALGARMSERASQQTGSSSAVASSFVLGVATGLLWAPCAGPILGLVLTGAALEGASARTSLLLLAYAAGAATSLALALLVGGRVFKAMKQSLGAGEWIRRGLGVALLVGVIVIAFGLDTGYLTRPSLARSSKLEQTLVDKAGPASKAATAASAPGRELAVEGSSPALSGATAWLNTAPLTVEGLRGKVVLVDFWTYSCINCLRSIPYVRAWAAKYGSQGLVVIGVHAPEFAFEKNPANVRKATKDLGIDYPVAVDNDWTIWRAFKNEYWPAHYFIDAQGRVRHHHFGEGDYAASERVIQRLLAEAGQDGVPRDVVAGVDAAGAQAAGDSSNRWSPETYVGYERAANFVAPEGMVRDAPHRYAGAPSLSLNQWTLSGDWTVGSEHVVVDRAGGRIAYRFHARDLHLVLGTMDPGKAVRFRVSIDGKPPLADHGSDADEQGNGIVRGQRLYQLIRQGSKVGDRLFEIEFLDPGAQAYAFTFG